MNCQYCNDTQKLVYENTPADVVEDVCMYCFKDTKDDGE